MDSTRPALRLLDLPLIKDPGRLADFLLHSIEPEAATPYALFVHSMGAFMAYEVACRVLDLGLHLPVWVGVSGSTAPQPGKRAGGRHELSDVELRTQLKQLGGTPDGVVDDPDLWAVFEPIIRADMRLVEKWRSAPGPLPLALSAYAGRQDHPASPLRMAHWKDHTTRFMGLRTFDGGHFHFLDDPARLLRQIEQDATTALDTRGRAQPCVRRRDTVPALLEPVP